jgi:hypothetical protein
VTKWMDRLGHGRLTTRRALALVFLAIIGLGATAAGFAIDATNFALHLLAGLVAFVATIIGAVLVLDELAERQSERRRKRKWDAVRVATLMTIWDQIRRVMRPIQMLSPEPNVFAVTYKTAVELMNETSAWTHTRAVCLEQQDADEFNQCRDEMTRLHGEVVGQYQYIRDVLAPRILELGDDETLVRLLFELDHAERRWSRTVLVAGQTASQHWRNYPVWTWGSLRGFCESVGSVADHIAPSLPAPGTLLMVWAADGKTSLEMEVAW